MVGWVAIQLRDFNGLHANMDVILQHANLARYVAMMKFNGGSRSWTSGGFSSPKLDLLMMKLELNIPIEFDLKRNLNS
jgi:hypothetical protein